MREHFVCRAPERTWKDSELLTIVKSPHTITRITVKNSSQRLRITLELRAAHLSNIRGIYMVSYHLESVIRDA